MILQGLFIAAALMLTLQMMLFIMSPATGLRAAFADSCHETGKVITHLFQIQRGPEQWIGVAAFGTVGIYVVIFAALDIVARVGH